MSGNNLSHGARNILGREEALQLLSPHMDCLVGAPLAALELFQTLTPLQLGPMRSRTTKGILNDATVATAIKMLDGVPGVVPNDDYEGTFLIFSGQIALRYKWIDRSDRTRNVPTDRQKEVDCQQLQYEGKSGLTWLTFGYRLDDAWQSFAQMKILCRRGDSILWHIQISEFANEQVLPLQQPAPDAVVGPAVRSKIKAHKKEGTNQ